MIKLDYTLESYEERAKYLQSLDLTKCSHTELNNLTIYLLWGKDENGLNGRQRGLDLPSKYWSDTHTPLSLEALMESPTFDESQLPTVPTKSTHSKFDRARVRAELANDPYLEAFEDLWRQIDTVDLTIAYATNKEPRSALTEPYDPAQLAVIASKAADLTPDAINRLKAELVNLRTEQYYMRASYAPGIRPAQGNVQEWDTTPTSIADLFNLKPYILDQHTPQLYPHDPLTGHAQYPRPSDFTRTFRPRTALPDHTKPDLDLTTTSAWHSLISYSLGPSIFAVEAPNYTPEDLQAFLDDPHPYKIDLSLESSATIEDYTLLMDVINYYLELAADQLSTTQKSILIFKLHHATADQINSYFAINNEKTYEANYIYTIFCKQILPAIVETVNYHKLCVENIFNPAKWKTCLLCGRTLVRDPYMWPVNRRVNDGYACRCRECNKRFKMKIKVAPAYADHRGEPNGKETK